MALEAGLVAASKISKDALQAFVRPGESENVAVFESSSGHLRAVVGSDRFKGKGLAERQDLVWEFLRNNVADQYLRMCFGVQAMDSAEFEAASLDSADS